MPPSSLISRLFRVRPTEHRLPLEDFFTEALAYVLAQHDELVREFVSHFARVQAPTDEPLFVSTQVSIAALDHHSSDSRPDLVIDNKNTGLQVWLESKIGSSEGPDQLSRYWDSLSTSNSPNKVLLYVTRDHDPKPDFAAVPGTTPPQFHQYRWHEVYHFLRRWEHQAAYVADLLAFMREHQMAKPHQFTPARILAFQHSPDAFQLMDEVLEGKVEATFKDTFTTTCRTGQDVRFSQLMKHNRYAIFWDVGYFEVLLGFSRLVNPDGQPADHPSLCVWINAGRNRKHGDFEANADALKSAPMPGWKYVPGSDWVSLMASAPINDILRTDNHVSDCQAWFLQRLVELKTFQANTTHLPWSGR